MTDATLPVFPLHTVLFPAGPLPLRIFEPRYLDMISSCMRSGSGFGVCLIRQGNEVGQAASTYEVGTLATIVDWHKRHDGLLGITVQGARRFRVVNEDIQPNQLLVAQVEYLTEDAACDVPADYLFLVDLLRDLIERVRHRYGDMELRYGDASWVGFRLAELLPLRLSQKQYFLQLDDPLQRLERIGAVLESLEIQY